MCGIVAYLGDKEAQPLYWRACAVLDTAAMTRAASPC